MGARLCKPSSSATRRVAVEERYCKPSGNLRNIDGNRLKKLILAGKLSPCYPGLDESDNGLDEECPICFLVRAAARGRHACGARPCRRGLNSTACVGQPTRRDAADAPAASPRAALPGAEPLQVLPEGAVHRCASLAASLPCPCRVISRPASGTRCRSRAGASRGLGAALAVAARRGRPGAC